jgi:hypothetical protein
VVQVLEEPQLVVAAHERRLEGVGPAPAAALGDDPQGPERRDGRDLPLEQLLADGLEGDGRRGRALRRLPHQHGSRRRHGLQPRRGVHEVARDHALVGRAERDRRLAGEHAGAGRDSGADGPNGIDELEGCAHGPLGVVLARDRRAPDRHHRVTDELLDRSAVPRDHVRRDREVPRQGLADVLAVALLGERGEADEVGEHHGDEAALRHREVRVRAGSGRHGGRGRGRGGATRPRERGAALAAEPHAGRVLGATRCAAACQHRAALAAESLAGRVRRPAAVTVHEVLDRVPRPLARR